MTYPRRGCAGLKNGLVAGQDALRTSYAHGTNIFGEPLAILFRRSPLDAVLSWNDERPFLLDLELYSRALMNGPIVVRRASVGAFRVSSSSWSTRMIKSQKEQLRSWQRELEQTLRPPPTTTQRAQAAFGLHQQMLLRQMAYRVLKLRGSFQSGPTG